MKDMRKLSQITDYRLGNQNEDIPDDLSSQCHIRFQPAHWLVGSLVLLRSEIV
jgi:hypothetical protein